MRKQIITENESDTYKLGAHIGARLIGGEILVLESDLGGGKTALARGIAEGIGSSDAVSSPTFTISHVYTGKKLTMHHYDFYRLGELGIMSEELQEVINELDSVAVIEWPEAASELLPPARTIHIKIDKDVEAVDKRLFDVTLPESLYYVLEGVEA